MRRSFRVGIRIGLLAGIVAAVAKMLQSRRNALAPDDGPDPWADRTLRPTPEPVHAPAVPTPPAAPAVPAAPAMPAAPEAAEPIPATAPTPAPAPAPDTTKTPGAAKAASPKKPATKKKAAPRRAWVEPDGNTCPTSHPIKAKLSSKLFHLPGMFAYDRTNPDRCYRDEAAAEGDGLTRAKR